MRDAYDKLFQKYNKEEFFRDSIEEIIFICADKLQNNWDQLKSKVLSNQEVYIRGYGRDALGTKAFIVLYKYLFQNEKVSKDPTNNAKPSRILMELTGLCKVVKSDRKEKERIQNYQVSHLFGRTKNPLLFTAGWNIAYIPKYIDPFTGHETQGAYRNEFQKLFEAKIFERFGQFVNDYNSFFINNISSRLEDALALTQQELDMPEDLFEDFRARAISELSEIKATNKHLECQVAFQKGTAYYN